MAQGDVAEGIDHALIGEDAAGGGEFFEHFAVDGAAGFGGRRAGAGFGWAGSETTGKGRAAGTAIQTHVSSK